MSRIRQIACSFDGTRIAAAESKRIVHVWDVAVARHIATFDTTLDFGGDRLGITSDGQRCIVGSYHRYGVAAYDSETGREQWRRKELKKVQKVHISHDNQLVFCGFSGRSGQFLRSESGETEIVLHDVREVHESPYAPIILVCGDEADFLLLRYPSCEQFARFRRATFALLDAAFAPGKICVTESTGPIRCFDVVTGEMCWRVIHKQGEHALKVGYSESDACFYCVIRPYQHGGNRRLHRLDANSGSQEFVADLGDSHEEAFCLRGSHLVDSHGRVWNLATGTISNVLEFPA
jgi:outer membrane protein assembly factor BamB